MIKTQRGMWNNTEKSWGYQSVACKTLNINVLKRNGSPLPRGHFQSPQCCLTRIFWDQNLCEQLSTVWIIAASWEICNVDLTWIMVDQQFTARWRRLGASEISYAPPSASNIKNEDEWWVDQNLVLEPPFGGFWMGCQAYLRRLGCQASCLGEVLDTFWPTRRNMHFCPALFPFVRFAHQRFEGS